jgi:hypothetical protein
MGFLGGALPNVMFIIGMLAIGLGLGIELKLVPLNKEIDRTGRIGAMVVGTVLVASSLFIYLNPSLTNPGQVTPTTANSALAPVVATPVNRAQVVTETATALPSAIATPISLPTETPVPTDVPTVIPSAVPSATPAPTATQVPSATPAPTATQIPTAVPPTQVPSVTVPDLHNLSEKEGQEMLTTAGLQASKVKECNGEDQGDSKARKNRVLCQNPPANAAVPHGTTVEYVLR